MTSARRARATPRLPIILGLIVVAIVILILLWDWNWFKPMIERRASAAIGRPVRIADFDVDLSRRPLLKLTGISVANPEGFVAEDRSAAAAAAEAATDEAAADKGKGAANRAPTTTTATRQATVASGPSLATVQALNVRIDAFALFKKKIVLPSIKVQTIDGELYTDTKGTANWKFVLPKSEKSDEPGFALELGRLAISESRLRFRDEKLKTDFTTKFRTQAGATPEQDRIRADLDGRYNGEPITGYFLGGALLGLRDPTKPYPVEARLANGPTKLALDGNVERDPGATGAQVKFTIQGPDLGRLYPLLPLPLPTTPAYEFSSGLGYADGAITLRNLKGRLGSSDIAGALKVQLGDGVPKVTGDLASNEIQLGDFAGFIGGDPPGGAPPPQTPSSRVLPGKKFDVPQLKTANVDLKYRAERIRGREMPLDELRVHLLLQDGRYAFKPLSFKVGKGEISTDFELDAREAEPRLTATAEFRKVDASKLLKAATVRDGGLVGGRVALKSRGNSIAEIMGRGNGEAQLFMQGGDLSALLVSIAGLDLGNSLFALIGIPRRTDVRCVVADIGLTDGLLQSRRVIADTELSNITLDGKVNFKDEGLDLRLQTDPKRLNIGSLAAPINIDGTMKDPKIRPDYVKVGIKAGLAVAAGVLLTPIAALLPTLQLGLGEDNDCKDLIADNKQDAKAAVATPPKKKARTRRAQR